MKMHEAELISALTQPILRQGNQQEIASIKKMRRTPMSEHLSHQQQNSLRRYQDKFLGGRA